ncbi:MAG: DNA repair ATPase, partial [Cellvibrionales bacterium]|nr:DNA repair ATPase [Cellvibrionales bacterium]
MSEKEASTLDSLVDNAVAEGGAYEVISKRLIEQGKQLEAKTLALNEARLEEFGSADLEAIARVRVRTENNCIARDIVQVGEHLLFGYNVFIGLKKETKVEDVFALFTLKEQDGNVELVACDSQQSFLADPRFVSDFEELYRYYKHTKLSQLKFIDGKLLAGFQIGERLEDIRVFRWQVSPDLSSIQYIDNRGERDIAMPPAFSFEWHQSLRDDIVQGRHPHINVLDTLFIEVARGELTIKVEDNSAAGLALLTEVVDESSQSLGDIRLEYAKVGELMLLKLLPYKESQTRSYIYNPLTETASRLDAIGESCVELPEDHGIIFPGGIYLQTGETKTFDKPIEGLTFRRSFRSPNGEDMLFIFYEPVEGLLGLFSYNLIEKNLDNPIYGHGYAKGEDGRIIIFNAEDEATRIHPMQIWQTPFVSEEFASKAPQSNTFLGRIGNSEVVRGISDIYSLCRMIQTQQVSLKRYEELNKHAKRLFDAHYWLLDAACSEMATLIKAISETAELVIDEFEKVESIRKQSELALADAKRNQESLLSSSKPDRFETAEAFVAGLTAIRQQRGHLMTIKSLRYMDLKAIQQLDEDLQSAEEKLSKATVSFLSDDKALDPYHKKIDGLNHDIEAVATHREISILIEQVESSAAGLDLLSELMATLQVDDATLRTRIIDAIAEVYAKLNQTKANAKHKQKNLGSAEAAAQFGAQFTLLSQSIVNGLGLATTPEKCDEQLSRLLVQLEELEGQFANFDEFLADIMAKREEIYESFEAHKQQLVDERQRKAQHMISAADRILESIQKRALKFTEEDALNTYLASDSLIMKASELAEQLRGLDDSVKADDVEARLKAIKEQAIRSLRDKTDIYEAGGNVIKLGPRHKFSVNTQALDLTLLPRGDELVIHLTGTDFYEPIDNSELLALKPYWDCALASESADVYRAEYLAYQLLVSAEKGEGLNFNELAMAAAENEEALNTITRQFAAPKYKDGYQKGIHDQDAAKILKGLLRVYQSAGLLRFSPLSRSLAQLFWHYKASISYRSLNPRFDTLQQRAQSAQQMFEALNSRAALKVLFDEMNQLMRVFFEVFRMAVAEPLVIAQAAEYLTLELTQKNLSFITAKTAESFVDSFKQSLDTSIYQNLIKVLQKLDERPNEAYQLVSSWLQAMSRDKSLTGFSHFHPEAAMLILVPQMHRTATTVDVQMTIEGLLGDHPKITNQALSFSLDDFMTRLSHHERVFMPDYQRYQNTKRQVVESERAKLRLHEFKPRPLSSFVRNRLI